MTPAELAEMADVYSTRERAEEREQWRRAAFVAATIMNSAGKTYRRTIKPDQLLEFGDGPKRMTLEERDRRKREAQETLLLHKQKFWTKFSDESVAKLTGK